MMWLLAAAALLTGLFVGIDIGLLIARRLRRQVRGGMVELDTPTIRHRIGRSPW